ncbi:hypothetical protein XJ44_08235 [Thermosipho affectus]|uniref:DUF2225 domain-containing protein n=1 Tax=Thermosipho affectus TaxID=660294 RepID=A0ABX3II41_9BACT|nr:DUF2225 domain-containing protein [Thermosipho affectus]ONN26842.1 hypothetical protein XJ44_08235 [Thermosipho affectus]
MNSLWDKDYKCPVCGKEFKSKKVRIDSVKISSYDEDLKPNFLEVNPFLYEVVVCPYCLYAEYEPKFENTVTVVEKDKIIEALDRLKEKLSEMKSKFVEKRNIDIALKAYGIVIILSTVTKKYCKLADAYLKVAWLLREKGDKNQEDIALAHALKNFEDCYMKSDIPEGKPEEKVLFYLGELNRYFNKKDESIKWFSVLIKKYGRSSSYYAKVGRDRWQSMRQ